MFCHFLCIFNHIYYFLSRKKKYNKFQPAIYSYLHGKQRGTGLRGTINTYIVLCVSFGLPLIARGGGGFNPLFTKKVGVKYALFLEVEQ